MDAERVFDVFRAAGAQPPLGERVQRMLMHPHDRWEQDLAADLDRFNRDAARPRGQRADGTPFTLADKKAALARFEQLRDEHRAAAGARPDIAATMAPPEPIPPGRVCHWW